MTFTRDQLEAVDVARRHLDACVVAGPGSGKTTVLVEYFKRLVAAGVDPLRILAITFTEKAAGNMRKKLAQEFQDVAEIRGKLERAWVSTVHGFCARLLRENAVFAGVDPEFTVADERESRRMQQESISAAIDALFHAHPAGLRALIRGLSSFEFEEAVLSAYDTMRGAGVRVDQLAGFGVPQGVTVNEIAAMRDALRNQPLTAWSHAQREHLKSILEGADRIATAAGPLEALRAIQGFSANLTKCRSGTAARELALEELRALGPGGITARCDGAGRVRPWLDRAPALLLNGRGLHLRRRYGCVGRRDSRNDLRGVRSGAGGNARRRLRLQRDRRRPPALREVQQRCHDYDDGGAREQDPSRPARRARSRRLFGERGHRHECGLGRGHAR